MFKNRSLVVFFSLLMVLALLIGCAPAVVDPEEPEQPEQPEQPEPVAEEPEDAPPEPIEIAPDDPATVRIWNWSAESVFYDMFMEYYAEYGYERVLCEVTAGDVPKLLASIAAGTPPDAMFINMQDAVVLAHQGVLRSLDEFMLAEGDDPFAGFHPGIRDIGLIDGKRYMFPWYLDFAALFYNKDLFEQAGLDPDSPPRTWEELENYARILTVFGADGMATQQGLAHHRDLKIYGSFAMQAGYWITPDGLQARASTPEVIRAMETYFGFDEVFGTDDRIPEGMHFNHGNVAMYVGSQMWGSPPADVAFEWGIAPVPGPDAQSAFTAAYSDWALILPINSRNPLGGYRLARWFAVEGTFENAAAHAASEGVNFRGSILSHMGAQERMNELMLNSDPRWQEIYNQTVELFTNTARFAPRTSAANLCGILLPLLEKVDRGELTVRDALMQFDTEFNEAAERHLRERAAMGLD